MAPRGTAWRVKARCLVTVNGALIWDSGELVHGEGGWQSAVKPIWDDKHTADAHTNTRLIFSLVLFASLILESVLTLISSLLT